MKPGGWYQKLESYMDLGSSEIYPTEKQSPPIRHPGHDESMTRRMQASQLLNDVLIGQWTGSDTSFPSSVDMSPQLAQALQRLRKTHTFDAAMKGDPLAAWIFVRPTHHRMSNELVRNAFQSRLTAAGLRHVRFHDLPHTFASLLIQQGANPKYIQQQLGHGSISITLDIYSHLFHGDTTAISSMTHKSERSNRRRTGPTATPTRNLTKGGSREDLHNY